jgi:acetate kinase
VLDGRSVDTTMGFTPMEGLVMATRSGSVDPGAILWAQRRGGLTPAQVEQALDRDSGLLGLSGTSGDMREVLEAAGRGAGRSRLALEIYGHRLRALVAAMAAALEGLDALVFTGGIGEHAAPVREAACAGLGFLGVQLDADRNRIITPDGVLSPAGSAVAVLLVAAREDLEMAREVRRVLNPT